MNRIIEEDLEFITNQKIISWKKFNNTTVLISGANGFLPAYLVETFLHLEKRGIKVKVVALVRNKEKAMKKFIAHQDNTNLQFIVQDVACPVNYCGTIDYIIHAASPATPKVYGADPVGTVLPNILGTINLLELAREKKIKSFLYYSSGEVYGVVSNNGAPISERDYGFVDPLEVRSCYAESKRMGENLCVSYAHQFDIPVRIIRPFHTYGPGLSLDDGRVFADFISDIVKKRNIELKGDGKAIRAFCYLADAAIAHLLVLSKGKIGEAYNIGADEALSIKDLAKKLTGLFPERKLKVVMVDRAKGDRYLKSKIQSACPDISKIKALGWIPKHSILEGFKRTVASFEEANG